MEPPSGARVPRSPSPPAEPPSRAPPSPSAQPWARLSAWLECACAVTFDLELGRPSSVTSRPLLFLQKTSICYLAFPDSYSGSLGDTQYCFRFRQSGARLREPPWAQSAAYRKEAPAALQQETAHYFGYVYFRQVKDPSVKRGYFQKSLVLVSRLPYVNLFQSLLQLVAPEYFDKLEPCLEAVCSEIDQWPPPVPGQTLNLPVMGVVIQVRIPSRVERPDASPVQALKQEVRAAWELCWGGGVIKRVIHRSPPPVRTLGGVEASLPLRHGSHGCRDRWTDGGPPWLSPSQLPPSSTFCPWNTVPACSFPRDAVRRSTGSRASAYETLIIIRRSLSLSMCVSLVMCYAYVYSPFSFCDTYLTVVIEHKSLKIILRIEMYIYVPPPPSLSLPPTLPACAAQNPPQIRPFRQEDFLKTLEHAGPQLTCLLKGDWMGLYRRFFRSPNFDGWYRQRRREMTHKLEALHLEAISEANIKAWMEDKSEAEVVDMVLKLREKLARARHHLLPVKEEALQQVGRSAGTLVGSLPEDLQAVLHHQ
uniref:UDENN domain-containing protein n=1 Tax=Anolis carolinensis TaxID=28377 RepID=H9GCM9_ANOCA